MSVSLLLCACAAPDPKPVENSSAVTPERVLPTTGAEQKTVQARGQSAGKTPGAATVESPRKPSNSIPLSDSVTAAAPLLQLKDLPLSLAGDWTLAANGAYANDCYLMSKDVKIRDGHGGGALRILVAAGKMLLISTSNIDMSYSDTGFSFDGGELLPLESLYSETAVLVENSYKALLTGMQSNSIMTVRLGFWPSWPVTKSYQARIEMTGFTPALKQLQACNALL